MKSIMGKIKRLKLEQEKQEKINTSLYGMLEKTQRKLEEKTQQSQMEAE